MGPNPVLPPLDSSLIPTINIAPAIGWKDAQPRATEGPKLQTTVNERDDLGSDLVPDYLTSVSEGGFYSWPYCYYGQHVDERVKPGRPDLVTRAIVPDYALGSHTASLGLAFYTGQVLPMSYRNGAFIGQHGS